MPRTPKPAPGTPIEGPTRPDVDARLDGLLGEAQALERAESAYMEEARALAWLASNPGFADDETRWEDAGGYFVARETGKVKP
jgi:hypothetical protein